jgi:hypothetical protein
LNFDSADIVDWSVFSRTRTELGADFVRILGYFREDGEKSLARIEEAMQRRDAVGPGLARSHAEIEARQFGAEPARRACRGNRVHRPPLCRAAHVPRRAGAAGDEAPARLPQDMELFDGETNPLAAAPLRLRPRRLHNFGG